MIWAIKIAAFMLCIVLWILGGQIKGRIRDVPVPIIIALVCAIALNTWWLFLVVGACMQIIRCGYGNYDPDDDKLSHLAQLLAFFGLKDTDGWWIRLAWGLLVGIVGGLGLFLCYFIGIIDYIVYIAIVSVASFLVSRWRFPVLLTDTLVGASVASLMFLI